VAQDLLYTYDYKLMQPEKIIIPSLPQDIKSILEVAVLQEATDVHLVVDNPVIFRMYGDLVPVSGRVLGAHDLENFLYQMITDKQKTSFQENMELDFSYSSIKGYFCRVNAHIEKGNIGITIRILPTQMRSPQTLGLPSAVYQLINKRKGLVVITGPAGSGKTTTLNCMLDMINHERKCKIITIEDPIEFVHQSKKSLIIQREVGAHTKSFGSALKYTLRQDPDIVVIGEMRDLESISMALTTAETGHLVITTLHAPDTIEAINRIVDVYPDVQQNQVRMQLADNLAAILGQHLIQNKGSLGRVLTTEVLISTISIRNMIRRGALVEIRGQMGTEEELGMHTFEQSLSKLVQQDQIERQTALEYAKYPSMLKFDPVVVPNKLSKTGK
jgi:twitching motility protein PilT